MLGKPWVGFEHTSSPLSDVRFTSALPRQQSTDDTKVKSFVTFNHVIKEREKSDFHRKEDMAFAKGTKEDNVAPKVTFM